MTELATITVRSAHLPDVRWSWTPGAESAPPPSGGGLGAALLRWLRIEVELRTPLGVERRAPWGKPGPSTWPALLVAPVLLVVVLVVVVVRRRRRRKG